MIGKTISHYTVLEKLGEGGMGVVYKARDTRLDREVALKFLPGRHSSSGAERARFIQEAKAAASLNHPNVCSVMDIQEYEPPPQGTGSAGSDSTESGVFIVMEFVDGVTLREKLGTISYKQALDIGTQIADGLAAAHEKGIVHRDIKPENVMVRKDGIAQIMDFGLAKLRGNVTRITKEGSTVGTAGYMSPEQVQGQDTDHRSDIFSLGVVLYELFTGRSPFKAAHESALMYEIVNLNAAPMSAVKPDTDPELERIVLGCLEKDPNDRTQAVKQVSVDLKRFRRDSGRQSVSKVSAVRPAAPGSSAAMPASEDAGQSAWPGRRGSRLPWIVAASALTLLAVVSYFYQGLSTRESPLYIASIQPPDDGEFLLADGGHMALSPDGSILAFVARDTSGKTALWVRSLNEAAPRRLADTEGAEYPFWSPDSRFIGYFVPGKMKKVLAAGGPPFVICDAPSGRGASWNERDVIIFAPRFDRTGIDRVSAGGGAVEHVTRLDSTRNLSNQRWPHFLPDGERFIYTTQAANRTSDFSGALYAASLDGTVDKHLLDLSTNVEYRDGVLLYVRQDALVSHRFNPGALDLEGDPVPVVDKIGYAPNRSKGVFSSSQGGVLIYLRVGTQWRTLSWLDRGRNELVSIPEITIDNDAALSSDGKRIFYDGYDPIAKNFDVWSLDIVRGLRSRLTFEPSDDSQPVPSPDGNRFVYTSWKKGVNLYLKGTSGTDEPVMLQKSITSATATDWSADGRYILFQDVELTADWDIWYRELNGNQPAKPYIKTEFTEQYGMFSPDGRWVAYSSDESGRNEVYVRLFPSGEGKWQVSSSGGQRPIWDRTGSGIFYASDQGVFETKVDASGPAFSVGESKLIFRNPAQAGLRIHGVLANGSRILVSHLPTNRLMLPMTLITDWKKKAGVK